MLPVREDTPALSAESNFVPRLGGLAQYISRSIEHIRSVQGIRGPSPAPIKLSFAFRMVVQGCMSVKLSIVLEVGPLNSEPVRLQAHLQKYIRAPEWSLTSHRVLQNLGVVMARNTSKVQPQWEKDSGLQGSWPQQQHERLRPEGADVRSAPLHPLRKRNDAACHLGHLVFQLVTPWWLEKAGGSGGGRKVGLRILARCARPSDETKVGNGGLASTRLQYAINDFGTVIRVDRSPKQHQPGHPACSGAHEVGFCG
jgi:hypothetical protein